MTVLAIITILLSSIYSLLILYYLWGWLKLPEFIYASKTRTTKISVLIVARNEAKNLPHLLDDLFEQNYHPQLFEVIVIDDHSTDQTIKVAEQSKLKNLQILKLQDIIEPNLVILAHKKKAIEAAINKAKGELIITTDADCRLNNNWLSTIANFYESTDAVMIAGPVNFFYDQSFLGKFQTLDFMSLVGIAAASIQNGFYNICNGANLIYTKEAFFAVGGYQGNDHIASGDDMMLMHKMAKQFPGKVAYLKNKDAIVYTHTEKDLGSFWRQRVRWTSKSTHYEDKRITLILSLVYVFNVLLVANLCIGLFEPFYLRLAMLQFLIKICVDTLFTYAVAKFFNRENLLWFFLPMQAAHVIYIILIAPAGVFGKYRWKGRTIH